ncbi:cation efflux system protein [Siccirubricoccus deserti]|uniref:Efflux RND transporter permease subunit n=1 Tax=Siccirubricoccus deserti TaxID=2013562 RepID=A0A9X0UF02_9PROT|nr:CusA/CzcA family heavy metal efflux RND transporter [Siccirubricoccus deserti]MBC4013930.1 efflux RND transporter permease subunit [Siccirubricoccus deserti]GGC30661.1 cation efflux system protein [Siccirubricoccus deserti]
MRQIVAFALQRRPLVILLFFVFIVVGLVAFTRLNIEAYPDPVPPQVVIITQNQGQSAEEIERYVTIPVEVAMAGLPNLTSVRSTSLFGLSDVRVQFNFNYTYDQALQQVLNRLAQIDALPAGVQPQISPLSPIGEIMRYRLVGPPGYSLTDLKTLQDWVLDRRFKRVPGVVDVTSFGGHSKSYNVVVDLRRMAAHGLSLPQVIAAVRAGNATVGAGTIRIGPQVAVVQGIGLIRGLDDLRNVVVTAAGGMPVLLADIATIEIGNLPRLGIAGHEGDDDVVLATVLMRRGEQTLPTIRGVQAEVARINAGGVLPPGVKIVPLYDREDLVKITTRTVVHNIIEGVALILIIQWLFLGDFRGALVVAATIPFAFLFAILLMMSRGESANLLSLGALDFGLLVDATVIMVENIYRHLGLARSHAHRYIAPAGSKELSGLSLTVLRAAGEVDKAIFFSALIIIAAFIPLFTLGGIEGRIFGPMSKTYAYAIIGALLATFTITPALAAALLKEDSRERDTPVVRALRWGHRRLYDAAMRARRLCLLLAAALLAGSIFLMSLLGAEFLPTLEEGNLWVRATMPGTISLEEGNGTVNRIRAVLLEFPEVITATSQQGRPDDGTDSAGFFNAEFFLPLKPPDQWTTAPHRDGLVHAMQARLTREFVGIEFSYSQAISDNVQEAASGVKGANAIKVYGPELDIIARKAEEIRQVMTEVQGVADLAVFRSLGQPTVAVKIDRARAARYGLAVDDVNQVVQAAIGGREAGRLYEPGGDRNFPVMVRLDAPFRDSLDAIQRIPVGGGSGATLADVADIQLVSGVSYIYREDASRYVPIRFSVRGRDPASTVAEAQALVAQRVEMPPGYRLDWVGEFRNLQEAIGRLVVVVPAALALILVLLYVQFNTLRETLLVFGIVPMSITGGVAALAVAGLNFSVPAAIGFLALFGITVMEGIIMLSHFNHLRLEGMPWRMALDQAGTDRMRPVFMTCFASFFGLLPMALASGIGADVQKPLALVVVGGIGLVPLFILVVFPAAIDLFGKPRHVRRAEADAAVAVRA